jgi:general nucleoside transport system permease protein
VSLPCVLADVGGVFSVAVLASGVRLAVPTALAAIGEAVSQRAGVFNLGLEGMMAVGAFSGFAVASSTGSPALGMLAGAAGGLAVSLLMAFGTVLHGTNMIVTGFSLVLLGQGLANFLYAQNQGRLKTFEPLDELHLGVLSRIPLFGHVLFRQNAILYLMLGLALVVALVLARTRFGLEVDASGSDAAAATAKGVNVRRTRTIAVLTAGLLAGLGGAAITVGSVGNFGSNITAGKGFVAISLVAIARGRIAWVLVAALLFGTLEAAQARLQDVQGIPVEFLPALPWIAVVLALLGFALARIARLQRAE